MVIAAEATNSERRAVTCSIGGYEVQVVIDGHVGRPHLDISKEQLEYLLAMGFSGPEISNAVGSV